MPKLPKYEGPDVVPPYTTDGKAILWSSDQPTQLQIEMSALSTAMGCLYYQGHPLDGFVMRVLKDMFDRRDDERLDLEAGREMSRLATRLHPDDEFPKR